MKNLLADLTANERRLIDLLANWHGPDVPNSNTLARLSDYSDSSGVRYALKRLTKLGLVTLQSLRGGTLTVPILTDAARAELGQGAEDSPLPVSILRGGTPLVAYPISCGGFEEANVEAGREITDARDFFSHWDCNRDNLLYAKGDSMVDDFHHDRSIHEGDWVQYRTQIYPANGETVYVQFEKFEGEVVCQLKVFHLDQETGLVTLSPLNSAYEPATLPGEKVKVLGVVMEVLSRRNARKRGHK